MGIRQNLYCFSGQFSLFFFCRRYRCLEFRLGDTGWARTNRSREMSKPSSVSPPRHLDLCAAAPVFTVAASITRQLGSAERRYQSSLGNEFS